MTISSVFLRNNAEVPYVCFFVSNIHTQIMAIDWTHSLRYILLLLIDLSNVDRDPLSTHLDGNWKWQMWSLDANADSLPPLLSTSLWAGETWPGDPFTRCQEAHGL